MRRYLTADISIYEKDGRQESELCLMETAFLVIV